jgi:hypothetical protein
MNAVVMPVCHHDYGQIKTNLTKWETYKPFLSDSDQKYDLVFYYNRKLSSSVKSHIEKIVESLNTIKRSFNKIYIRSANLAKLEDKYDKSTKIGPNLQFFHIMDKLKDSYQYIFLMETDCYPIKTGWLSELHSQAVNQNPSFWVKGSVYRGTRKSAHRVHINGNALYHIGDPLFQKFLGRLRKYLEYHKHKHAYDLGIFKYLNEDSNWREMQTLIQKFVFTHNVQNYWAHDTVQVKDILEKYPQTYLIHGKHVSF